MSNISRYLLIPRLGIQINIRNSTSNRDQQKTHVAQHRLLDLFLYPLTPHKELCLDNVYPGGHT